MATAKESYDKALAALHRRADMADGRGPGFHFTDREVIALSSWIKGKDQEIANLKRQLDYMTRDEVTPDVEIIVTSDEGLVVKVDRKPVMRIESAYHLKITGLTEDGDKIDSVPVPQGYKRHVQPEDEPDLSPEDVANIKHSLSMYYGDPPWGPSNLLYKNKKFLAELEAKYNMYLHELRKVAGRMGDVEE